MTYQRRYEAYVQEQRAKGVRNFMLYDQWLSLQLKAKWLLG